MNTNPSQTLSENEEERTLPNPLHQASITLIPTPGKDIARKKLQTSISDEDRRKVLNKVLEN